MPGPRALQCALCLLLPLWPSGAEGRSARRVAVKQDTVVRLATQVRYTTLVVVPADERILEFVLGDAERWDLVGAANIALLKPLARGARTSVTLITDAGRIYAFTAAEGPGPPDVMVHVRHALPFPLPPVKTTPPVPVSAAAFPPAPVLGGGPGPGPAALVRPAVPVLLPAWAPAAPVPEPVSVPAPVPVPVAPPAAEPPGVPPASSSAIGEDAALVEQAAPAPVPRGTMRFEYALDAAARGDPFQVVAMWNDGERTWFRSPAAGQWGVYAAGDGFDLARLACEPVEAGLCAVRGVLGDGALRMGGREARWRLLQVRDPR